MGQTLGTRVPHSLPNPTCGALLLHDVYVGWQGRFLSKKEFAAASLPKVASEVPLVLQAGFGICKEETCPLPSLQDPEGRNPLLHNQSGSRIRWISPHSLQAPRSPLLTHSLLLLLLPQLSWGNTWQMPVLFNCENREPDSSGLKRLSRAKGT